MRYIWCSMYRLTNLIIFFQYKETYEPDRYSNTTNATTTTSNTMESGTVHQIIQAHNRILRWSSKLVVPHGNSNTDVSCAAYRQGHKRHRPLVDNLPSNLPTNSLYQFDPQLFCGQKSVGAIESAIKSSCNGCTLHRFKYGNRKGDNIYFSLRCACYRTKCTSKVGEQFTKKNFSKDGLKPEHVIQTNSKKNVHSNVWLIINLKHHQR